MPAHDTRYAIADEYLEVLYKLWEGSWDEDALLADRGSGVHADPSKIHPINHVGEHFKCEGPFLVTPSPQRTPLLFQAGSSPVGRDFCARHAEAQFIQSPSTEDARKQITETRDLLEKHGRTRDEIEFFQGLSFVVGATEEEALPNERELEEKIDVDGMVAHMGGAAGGGNPTVRDVMHLMSRRTRIVGTPEQIADRLAEYREAGVDGVNVINATIPGSYDEFIDQVMPTLRERGLAADGNRDGTLRNKLFGHDRLTERHPAAQYRGAFADVEPAAVV